MKLKIAGIVVLIITLLSFPAYAGTWQKNKDKIRYKRDDGSYVISDWVEDVDGRWYYFDSDGLMVTKSWVQGKYYVNYEGVMLANTITPDGYRVNSHGEMVEHVSSYNEKCDCKEIITIPYDSRDFTYEVYYKKQYTAQNGSTYEIDGFVTDKDGKLYVNYHLISGEGNIKIPITGYEMFNDDPYLYFTFRNSYDVRLVPSTNRVKVFLNDPPLPVYKYVLYIGNPISQK